MPSLHTCIWWKTWHLRSLSHIGSVAIHIAGDWAQSFCQVFKSKKKKHWKLSPDSHIVINCSFQPCNIHPYNMTKIPRSLRCVISDCQMLKFKSRQPHVLIPTFYPQGSRKKKQVIANIWTPSQTNHEWIGLEELKISPLKEMNQLMRRAESQCDSTLATRVTSSTKPVNSPHKSVLLCVSCGTLFCKAA